MMRSHRASRNKSTGPQGLTVQGLGFGGPGNGTVMFLNGTGSLKQTGRIPEPFSVLGPPEKDTVHLWGLGFGNNYKVATSPNPNPPGVFSVVRPYTKRSA